jgi:hypothetical protein
MGSDECPKPRRGVISESTAALSRPKPDLDEHFGTNNKDSTHNEDRIYNKERTYDESRT